MIKIEIINYRNLEEGKDEKQEKTNGERKQKYLKDEDQEIL
jgi:hypothetical protein